MAQLCRATTHRVVKVGKDHWKSSSPTSSLKQDPLEHAVQNCIQTTFYCFQRRWLHKLISSAKTLMPCCSTGNPWFHWEVIPILFTGPFLNFWHNVELWDLQNSKKGKHKINFFQVDHCNSPAGCCRKQGRILTDMTVVTVLPNGRGSLLLFLSTWDVSTPVFMPALYINHSRS